MKQLFMWMCGIALITMGCGNTPEEPLREEPILNVESLTPTDLLEFSERLTLVLFYRDEQGDLGDFDPDEQSLWIKDSRLPEADTYHVQPITNPDGEVPIEGTLTVDLGRVFLLGNGTEETFFYTIQIKDREGNWSEEIQSPSVIVRK